VKKPNFFCEFSEQKTLCERSCVLETKYCSLRVRCGPVNSENSPPIDFKFSELMPVCTKKIHVTFFCKTPSLKKLMAF